MTMNTFHELKIKLKLNIKLFHKKYEKMYTIVVFVRKHLK